MEIKINKEIRDYKETIFFGLSMRQFIFSILACGVALLLYFSFRNILGIETLSWICILCAIPFGVLGFIKYNGMNAEQVIIAFIKSEILMPKVLYYKPENLYYELLKEDYKTLKKEEVKNEFIKYIKSKFFKRKKQNT